MKTLKFRPEGWNNEISKLNSKNIESYIESGEILQGLVKKCDDQYNLYVGFENNMTGIVISIIAVITHGAFGNIGDIQKYKFVII